jgi:hypothetical protein
VGQSVGCTRATGVAASQWQESVQFGWKFIIGENRLSTSLHFPYRLSGEQKAQVDRGRDSTVRATPRADPDGRSLAHPVLIADDWRRSDPRDKDGVLAVGGAIGQPERAYVSRRAGVSDFGGGVHATNAQLVDPGIR